jgi:hypothetical protein
MLSCKAIRELYEKANSISRNYPPFEPKLSIEFVHKLECEALFNPNDQSIQLRDDLSENEAMSSLAFEWTNAINQAKFRELNLKARTNAIGSEDYAKEVERIEFEGGLLHSKVMRSAIKEMGWDKSLDMFSILNQTDFEHDWHSRLRFTPHAQYGRESYSSLTDCVPPAQPGFKAKCESMLYLATHISSKDVQRTIIGSLPGLAIGLITGPQRALMMAGSGAIGAIAQRVLQPFKTSSTGRILNIFTVFVLSGVASSHYPTLLAATLFGSATGVLMDEIL